MTLQDLYDLHQSGTAPAARSAHVHALQTLARYARDGVRLVYYPDGEGSKPKTLWAGLGNRAGLHSFATTILEEKWTKSGARFKTKIAKLPRGTRVVCLDFRNTTRDRGRWTKFDTRTLGEVAP